MKEDEIRPDRLRAAQQEAIDWDIAWLLERSGQWAEVDCPACAGAHHAPEFDKLGFRYRRCADCGTLFTSPRPAEAVLEEFYDISRNYAFFNQHIFPASESARLEKIFRPRARLVAGHCAAQGIRGGRMLEIGAGFGTFVRAMRELALMDSITVVQTGPLAGQCRERGADKVISSLMGELSGEEPFDLVTSFEVIEHTFDPLGFLRNVRNCLRPGGLLVLSCPNAAGFDIAELGPHSDSVDHEHLNYFNPASLRLLLERAGLRHVDHGTPGKLDVELVRKKWLARPELARDPFLAGLVLGADETARQAFQQFLAASGLSSHLVMVAARTMEEK
ncbi:class I SAM-dependent methyltransferase [Humidesulfovibrio idahonensis]